MQPNRLADKCTMHFIMNSLTNAFRFPFDAIDTDSLLYYNGTREHRGLNLWHCPSERAFPARNKNPTSTGWKIRTQFGII